MLWKRSVVREMESALVMIRGRLDAVLTPGASALARNYPGMLTESDPPAQRGRGMIMPCPSAAYGPRCGAGGGQLYRSTSGQVLVSAEAPGVHRVWTQGRDVEVETHKLLETMLTSVHAATLVRSNSALVDRHFIRISVGEGRVAVRVTVGRRPRSNWQSFGMPVGREHGVKSPDRRRAKARRAGMYWTCQR